MNDEGELRCGWRVLAFVLLFVLAEMLLTGVIKTTATLFPSLAFILAQPAVSERPSAREFVSFGVQNVRSLATAVIATAICARVLERRSFASVGFKLHRGWSRDFGLGSLLGAASLAIAVGIAAGAGAISFVVQTTETAGLARDFIIVLMFFLVSGATEELIFRGFAFQALAHNLGGAAAIGITSVIFGLAHLSNDSASAFSTINTILAGIWLGLAYLITRSLWLATALHYSWNFVMVFVFGLPVSGYAAFGGLAWLRGSIGAPLWVSGGSYGPEGGVAATVALILSTLVIWKSGLFGASEEMLEAIKHGKREAKFVRITPEAETAQLDADAQNDDRL